ncbi:glycosyltransferase [Candidatus Neomarinimicrobiota bacterium]
MIIEFSAAGLSEYVKNSNPIIRYLALRVYGNANGAIQRSLLNPPDGEYFKAKEILTVQGGVPDCKYRTDFQKNNPQNPISILYAGIIHESKGVMVLLKAIRLVRDQNYNFKLSIMGEFTSNAFKNKVQQFISDNKLDDKVLLPGFKKGKDKWDQYNKADIFCFPTFYETESFGLVIVEAMMFELPVITTNWRAIPDIVSDSETGFLIPIKNSEILAEKIILLISDSELRKKMGYAGREKYLNEFTMDRFVNRFELCVVETLKSN